MRFLGGFFFFSLSAIVSVREFYVRPKEILLLPTWPGEAKSLNTPVLNSYIRHPNLPCLQRSRQVTYMSKVTRGNGVAWGLRIEPFRPMEPPATQLIGFLLGRNMFSVQLDILVY